MVAYDRADTANLETLMVHSVIEMLGRLGKDNG